MQSFPHFDEVCSEFILLSLHVLANILFALSERFLNNMADPVLQVFELAGNDPQHLVVEVVQFVSDIVHLVLQF